MSRNHMDAAADPSAGATSQPRQLSEWFTVTEPTPEDVRRARLMVCSHARDTADARVLLEVLGIGADR